MTNQEQSAQQLFGAALNLAPEHRSAFLDQACREAPELRPLVDELFLKNELPDGHRIDSPFRNGLGTPSTAVTSPTNRDLGIGTKLGRYTIVELLGAGGMGVVYRARDEKLERAVAIKILAPGLLTGDDARRRFHKEALALAKLSLPTSLPYMT